MPSIINRLNDKSNDTIMYIDDIITNNNYINKIDIISKFSVNGKPPMLSHLLMISLMMTMLLINIINKLNSYIRYVIPTK